MATEAGQSVAPYRGRLAPSPTGLLHLGHARTFWTAQERARARSGTLILRNEDLDPDRSKPEYVAAMIEDLRWFGFEWQEGPDCGGPFGPYNQSERRDLYRAAFEKLRDAGLVYPCTCSRRDIQSAAAAPHAADDEVIYPGTCRPADSEAPRSKGQAPGKHQAANSSRKEASGDQGESRAPSWRFRVPDGEAISFTDSALGRQECIAGRDFGDFVVWRPDGVPSYQLAVVVDDAAMRVTEVVRGADLLVSTARQLLLYRALNLTPPAFHHCALMTDERGERLAKRHDSLSLRALREQGARPETIRRNWNSSSVVQQAP
jgi:glutamyl/glutaminyl-tRNA synthetase